MGRCIKHNFLYNGDGVICSELHSLLFILARPLMRGNQASKGDTENI